MKSVGFKEWALVCEALGRGEQTIIVRKGGIAEGREGFTFQHREFFLFPTFFHEQVERVRSSDAQLPAARDGEIVIEYFARLEFAVVVHSWETAAALEPFHILRPEVVRERFEYDEAPGVHVAAVRVFRLTAPWIFADAPRYGGCRSWVTLPDVSGEVPMEPVRSDAEHAATVAALRAITADAGACLSS